MEEDIWESLKNFKFDIDSVTVPWGTSRNGEANFMYGLRGENHPASAWLKNEATKDYFERRNAGVKRSWMNDTDRRKSHSETMKEKWVSGKIDASTARKNGNHGLKGVEIHNTLEIEYKGKTYYGWRELKEGTGVTKHLYNKYYLNNIDPETRIGTDGPAKDTP
jgi:hypothetical protein